VRSGGHGQLVPGPVHHEEPGTNQLPGPGIENVLGLEHVPSVDLPGREMRGSKAVRSALRNDLEPMLVLPPLVLRAEAMSGLLLGPLGPSGLG
jgi:hypothetical protein